MPQTLRSSGLLKKGLSSGQQHDLGSPDVLLRSVAVPDEGLKALALDRRDGDGNPGAHAPHSHAQTPEEIPQGIQSLDFDH